MGCNEVVRFNVVRFQRDSFNVVLLTWFSQRGLFFSGQLRFLVLETLWTLHPWVFSRFCHGIGIIRVAINNNLTLELP